MARGTPRFAHGSSWLPRAHDAVILETFYMPAMYVAILTCLSLSSLLPVAVMYVADGHRVDTGCS